MNGRKLYYPSGILKSVEFTRYGEPCHTWLTYKPDGTLEHTIKITPLNKLPKIFKKTAIAEDRDPQIFIIVQQDPEFPGGEYNLNKYLADKLRSAVCSSRSILHGKYIIEFEIAQEGEVNFKSLCGENYEAIDESIKEIINQSPKWKPAKRQGRTASTILKMELVIR